MGRSKDAGDSASVRVDIDGVEASSSSATGDGQNSSRNWLIVGLGVVVLLAVGLALFLLRPEQDAAADGTIREAPTEEAPTPVISEEEIVPLPIRADGAPSSIVRFDGAYLGLVAGQSSTPTIIRSEFGLIWEAVPTSALSLGIPNEERRNWSELTTEDGRLTVRGRPLEDGGSFLGGDIFVSDSGLEWAQLDGIGSLSDHPLPELPLAVRDTYYFAYGTAMAEQISRFVANHTSLGPTDLGYCYIRVGGSVRQGDAPSFEVGECSTDAANVRVNFLVSQRVDSTFSSAQVLECARTLASTNFGNAIIHQELETDGQRTIVNTGFVGFPVSLSSGSIAAIDSDWPESGEPGCEGMVDLPARRERALLIVDEDGQASRWPLPESGLLRSGPVPETSVLGELQRDSGGPAVLVGHEDGLWVFDTVDESWTEVHRSSEDAPIGELNFEVRVTENSKWLYSISDGTLVVVNLESSDVSDTDSTRSVSIPFAWPDGFEFDSILYADDEVVFVKSNLDVLRFRAPTSEGN